MEINRSKTLNPFLETLGLLYMVENFETVKEDMLHSLEEMGIDSSQFYKQNLSYLESYVNEFKTSYILNPEEAFFFGYNTEFFLTVLAAAMELFETGDSRLDKQRIFAVMGSFFHEEKRDIHTMEEWFSVLKKSEYSEDTKWRILELLHEPVEKFKKLYEIYERNRPAFDYTYKKNEKHLEKLISEAPADISEAMQNILSEFYPAQKKVYLTAVIPLIEWITPTMAFQGVLADKADVYRENLNHAKEMLPQILKLLGDKSKFEILCLLKNHGKYNLEIAEELHFTPATASHHMSMLLSNRMVTVEKKNGRVYYQLNQETLKEIVKWFGEIFL